MTEIVARSDHGIDLHSAAIHRTNLPQLRVSPSQPDTLALARAFGAPLIMHSKIRDGSLRSAAQDRKIDVLVYEAGEGLRFDEGGVRTGVSGILRVMAKLEMLAPRSKPKAAPLVSSSSTWLRAPAGGLLRAFKGTGDTVEAGDVLGIVSDPFGEMETEIACETGGLVIGRTVLPNINEGDALFHVAKVSASADPEATISDLAAQIDADPIFDEDEII